jgi:hypothetical protein
MAVKKIPNTIFRQLFAVGFNSIDKQIIKEGMANNSDAKNRFTGLSRLLFPSIIPDSLLGTYNSK